VSTALVYDENYAEDVILDDGTKVRLRLIRPDDKDLMLRAWERLSPESRYRRFFAAKTGLTDAELRYLTEVNHVDHVAIGATHGRRSKLEALGIGRCIRFADRPTVADIAITVVDDAQGKGLGRILLARLIAAARERGIERFRCDVLAENEGMRNLIRSMVPETIEHSEGPIVTVEMPLAEAAAAPDADERKSLLYRLLALIGRG
jgi:GNAT superfamily N-acetyltransferase